MDKKRFLGHVEQLLDMVERKIDNPDANSVWSNATRVGGSPVGSIPVDKDDLGLLIDLCEEHDVPAVQRVGKSLRTKYLGE